MRHETWLIRAALLAAGVALYGCAEPRIEFRGYSDRSSCAEIIDAEMANGATFQGGRESEDVENPGYITELDGELFGERVYIDVHCNERGLISSIHYISTASDPIETGEVFHRLAAELDALFGEPTTIVTEDGRSMRYLCNNPSPVLLDEFRLFPEDDAEPAEDFDVEELPHEVYVAVQPRAAECMDPP